MDGTITDTTGAFVAAPMEYGFVLVGALVIAIGGWVTASRAECVTIKAWDKNARIDATLKPVIQIEGNGNRPELWFVSSEPETAAAAQSSPTVPVGAVE